MKCLNLFTTLLFSFLFLSAQAQFECSDFAAGIDFNIKNPVGTLQQNGLKNLYGMNVEGFYLGFRTKNFIIAPGYRITGGSTAFKHGETFVLDNPEGGTATERLSVEYIDLTGLARVIFTKQNRLMPYAELYAGIKGMGGYERLRIDQDLDGYENTKDKLFNSRGTIIGAGFGVLYKLTNNTYLNLKVSREWRGDVRHFDLADADNYSTDIVLTENAKNLGFNIGVFVVIGCREDRKRNNPMNKMYLPKRKKPQSIKRKTMLKT